MRVGVDIGGTFTDVVVFDEQQGSVRLAKALSTPHELARGECTRSSCYSPALSRLDINHKVAPVLANDHAVIPLS